MEFSIKKGRNSMKLFQEELLNRKIHETERVRKAFFALIIIWCVFALISSSTAEWENGTFVQLNPAQAPISATISETALLDAIRYSAWSWQQRTGIDISVQGTTTANVVKDGIVVRWEPQQHFDEMKLSWVNGYTRRWIYPDTLATFGYEIVLNLQTFNGLDVRNMRTITHEIGHALGIKAHSSDPHSVMAVPLLSEPARYSLSIADALQTGSVGSLCHAELTREFDIYIPDIQNQRAVLKYLGGETWKLQILNKNPQPQTCHSVTVNPLTLQLYFSDLRTVDTAYRATLDFIGNDTWKLHWAQQEDISW
jgi:hypothetical protein